MLQHEKITEDLRSQGFSVVPDAFSGAELETLRASFAAASASFVAAGVGRGARAVDDVRRDRIGWLSEGDPPELWRELDALRVALNASLFLGLWDLEGHFALYPPGGFYARHLDRFRDLDTRVVSIVLYLTRDWSPGDGGELRLYPEDREPVVVEPRGGTLVVFMSGELEHEVAVAARERWSFAGWFRRRG